MAIPITANLLSGAFEGYLRGSQAYDEKRAREIQRQRDADAIAYQRTQDTYNRDRQDRIDTLNQRATEAEIAQRQHNNATENRAELAKEKDTWADAWSSYDNPEDQTTFAREVPFGPDWRDRWIGAVGSGRLTRTPTTEEKLKRILLGAQAVASGANPSAVQQVYPRSAPPQMDPGMTLDANQGPVRAAVAPSASLLSAVPWERQPITPSVAASAALPAPTTVEEPMFDASASKPAAAQERAALAEYKTLRDDIRYLHEHGTTPERTRVLRDRAWALHQTWDPTLSGQPMPQNYLVTNARTVQQQKQAETAAAREERTAKHQAAADARAESASRRAAANAEERNHKTATDLQLKTRNDKLIGEKNRIIEKLGNWKVSSNKALVRSLQNRLAQVTAEATDIQRQLSARSGKPAAPSKPARTDAVATYTSFFKKGG